MVFTDNNIKKSLGTNINSGKFEDYVETKSDNPFIIASQLKRKMKFVLLDFYWLFIKLYYLLYGNTKYGGYLPSIIK